jgi:hypothetical protein
MIAALSASLWGCQEYTYSDETNVDVFQQRALKQVDVLVVIDNSCSMVEEQSNLAVNFDALVSQFSAAEVDWRLAVVTTDTELARYRGRLMGGDDEVIVRGPSGGVLSTVAWVREWAFQVGVAKQLSGEDLSFGAAQTPTNWCDAPTPAGTPGERNPRCVGGPVAAPEAQPDAGPRAPTAGELVVSELMTMGAADKVACDWVELTNTTPDTLSLDGLTIGDVGSDLAPLSGEVGPWEAFVVGRSDGAGCGYSADLVISEGFSLADDRLVIGPDTPAAAEAFSELVSQGTSGSGIEMGFEAARLALSEPLYTEKNQAWLRPEASLSVLIVSDEEDASPLAVDDYVRFFTDLKGDVAYRDRQWVNLSAVVGTEKPPRADLPSCETANGFAGYGARYLKAVQETGGIAESICSEDFAPLVNQLGLTLSGLESEFYLSGVPRLSDIEVTLFANAEDDSKIADLVFGVDYTYVSDGNYLLFEGAQVPAPEQYVVARYVVLPDTAIGDVTEAP